MSKTVQAVSLSIGDNFWVNDIQYEVIEFKDDTLIGEAIGRPRYKKAIIPLDSFVLVKDAMPKGKGVVIHITEEQRINLLCSALEGGSNYWYWLHDDATKVLQTVPKQDTTVDWIWAAIVAGKEIPVRDGENLNDVLGKISLASIEKGEQIMAEKYPNHFADIIADNDDAATGDIWFQLAVMGEVVYG